MKNSALKLRGSRGITMGIIEPKTSPRITLYVIPPNFLSIKLIRRDPKSRPMQAPNTTGIRRRLNSLMEFVIVE